MKKKKRSGRAVVRGGGWRVGGWGVSVADCLGRYISGFSEEIYKDEYFTCFRLRALPDVR